MMSYKQSIKNKVRNEALTKSVNVLTSNRYKSAVVPKDYVFKAYEFLQRSESDYYRILINECAPQDIVLWEELHNSFIGNKSAADLKVAYLCGPEPMNDFSTLIEMGIHPHNIWAFENDDSQYNLALSEIRESYFPTLKIYNGNIQEFFNFVPKKFDIIYIDACGPLPSTTSKTLSILSTLFLNHKLESPGVLLTNFSCPDYSDKDIFDSYSYLIGNYLYPKKFLEDLNEDGDVLANDSAESQGFSSPEEYIHSIIKPCFEDNYGYFITRSLFDLPSFMIPWLILSNSKALWDKLFIKTPRALLQEKPEFKAKENKDENLEEFYRFHIENFEYLTNTTYFNNIVKPKNETVKKLCNAYINQLHNNNTPPVTINSALDCFFYLSDYDNFREVYTPNLKTSIYNFIRMPKACDNPNPSLGFSAITGQYSYPMHYNTLETNRWKYKAKDTYMYMDLVVYDECRYIYEWIPTLDLFYENIMHNLSYQIILRLAIDGLGRHSRWYNHEYFRYSAFIGHCNDNYFNSIYLKPRKLVL